MSPLLRRIARRQGGCFTIAQAKRCGVDPRDIQRHLLAGEWLRPMADVLIVAGAPVTDAMRAWTAVLAIGHPVALTGLSAGTWLDLEQVPPPERPQLIVPNNRHPMDLPALDVTRVVLPRWRVWWSDGMPLAPMPLIIRDMAPHLTHAQLRDVVHHALRRRRTTFEALTRQLGRGRPGAAALRRVLEEVAPGYHVKWERLLHRALLPEGVVMTPQVRVEGRDGRVCFVDLGIEELRFGVEIDGFLNHMARFRADRQRSRLLAYQSGWTIAPYAVDELADDMRSVVKEIVEHVHRLRRQAA